MRPEADGALWHPSPNFGPRRDGARPDLIVLHYTAMDGCAAARDRLCDPAAEVSAHYLVGESGSLIQMVPEAMRAWHAGIGAWGPVPDVNSRSIGIELDNPGNVPFAEPQLAGLEKLLAGIMARRAIPPERIIGHSDMAPARKSDPGPHFPWRRLAAAGLSVWPDAADGAEAGGGPEGGPVGGSGTVAGPEGIAAFTAALTAFGYRGGAAEDLLPAFRQRFRLAAGPLDSRDVAIAVELARRWPVLPA